MTERVRVLRVLEYIGTREFVEKSLECRTIKEAYSPSEGNVIREAIVGGILGFEELVDTSDANS